MFTAGRILFEALEAPFCAACVSLRLGEAVEHIGEY
jgi:hypothetical protein